MAEKKKNNNIEKFINDIGDEFLERPNSPDNTTDKFSDNGSDNAVTRAEINASIISKATANEAEYVKALKAGIPHKKTK